MEKKTVYVPVGPSTVCCACGAEFEIKNYKRPGAGEVIQLGECKNCNLDFEINEAKAGESKFSKIIFIADDHHVHCHCGDHVHMHEFTHPETKQVLSIGYCLPCNIEVRTF